MLLNQRHVLGQQIAVRLLMKRLHPEDRVRVHERCVYGRTRDHAVVVGGIPLDLGEALPPAGGASLPVRVLRRTAVIARDEPLAYVGGDVRRAMTEVDNRLDVWLARRFDREFRVEGAG